MFRLATIIAINEANNKIKIKDLYNFTVYDISLENHIHFQSMPLIGDIVLYLNLSDKIFKIVKIWQIKDDKTKRIGDYFLKSGELQIQGIYGQYIYLDNNGTIKFVDSSMLNEFELNMEGFIAKLKQFKINSYDNISFTIDKEIILQKQDDKNKYYTIAIMDENIKVDMADGNAIILIDKQGNITIKGNSIKIGNQFYGDIITSGPNGTYPICPVTGSIIKGSSKCKAEG